MRKPAIALAVWLVIAVTICTIGCSEKASPTPTLTSMPTPTPIVTPSTSTPPPNTSSTTSKSVKGLMLSLSLNSTTFQLGQEVSVVIDEQNTLAKVNNVSTSNSWPLEGLTVGPCGPLDYPIGWEIFQGYYTSPNVSSATPLQVYDPSAAYGCPGVSGIISAYVFQPSSDIANVLYHCNQYDSNQYISLKMSSEISVTGYWTWANHHEPVFGNFTPGVYTVVGGDEWGSLAVLHFVVQ